MRPPSSRAWCGADRWAAARAATRGHAMPATGCCRARAQARSCGAQAPDRARLAHAARAACAPRLPGAAADARTAASVSGRRPRRRTSSKPLKMKVLCRSPRGMTGAAQRPGGVPAGMPAWPRRAPVTARAARAPPHCLTQLRSECFWGETIGISLCYMFAHICRPQLAEAPHARAGSSRCMSPRSLVRNQAARRGTGASP